ncbi:GNAT family N-acetyltransferase [Lacicoccus qingdaonensis]|uniref:GNAT family N-acetyltransferase n=1 Tax=Lacicoccus qingdaonensis TaxID=576118 RepID=UPI000AC27CBA|nr:GNAT family N-acetyltransferase [Salinicoccus qingdaonensis]
MPVIKELKTMEELKLVQDMEERVWEMSPIPTHQTFTSVKNGGLMLAAFVDDEIVGFSYGFPGFKNDKSYLCSHMLAVDPAYRSRKIGEKLKWRQREVVIDKGYDMILWTFDPLETRNGYLNLSKLNAVCHTYIENCYGEMSDGMNKGLPSDRFEVHWHLNSPHVTQRTKIDLEHAVPLNAVRKNEDGLPVFVGEQTCESDDVAYSLAVPKDFQELKVKSPGLALDWRLKTREKFEQLFDAGYSAVHLKVHDDHAEYIFVKKKI